MLKLVVSIGTTFFVGFKEVAAISFPAIRTSAIWMIKNYLETKPLDYHHFIFLTFSHSPADKASGEVSKPDSDVQLQYTTVPTWQATVGRMRSHSQGPAGNLTIIFVNLIFLICHVSKNFTEQLLLFLAEWSHFKTWWLVWPITL